MSTAAEARVVEIFSSIQGEGIDLGERQIFVRFGGCNLHCDYCDEPDTIPIPSGRVMSLARVKAEIERLSRERPHRSVSWTGGEPLLHPEFLAQIMPWAQSLGLRNYLETNGTLPAALKRVLAWTDAVSMDIKLPSSTGRKTWALHREFLSVAPEKTFVKVVLTADSRADEVEEVISLVSEAPAAVPLILQPATAFGAAKPIPPERAILFLNKARAALQDVRLIPQWHPVWNLP